MSGSIWDDEDIAFEEPRSRWNAKTACAREDFVLKSNRVKNEIMACLSLLKGLNHSDDLQIARSVTTALNQVKSLANEVSNGSEKDIFVVCDMLAISLATAFTECMDLGKMKLDAKFQEIINKPYISNAMA